MPLHAFIFESENIVSLEYKSGHVFRLHISNIYSKLIFTEQKSIQFLDTRQNQNNKNSFRGNEKDPFSFKAAIVDWGCCW